MSDKPPLDALSKEWGGEIRSRSSIAALRDAFAVIEVTIAGLGAEPDPTKKLKILLDVIAIEFAKIHAAQGTTNDP